MDNPGDLEAKTVLAKKQSTKAVVLYVFVILLVVGLVGIGWLYYQSNRRIGDQHMQIGDLQQQLKDQGIVPVGSGAEETDGAATCNGGSAYSADIGNFAITLSDPNIIIRNLDANFEGGPVTDLSVGQCLAAATNVVDAYLTHKVNILAHPSENAATLRSNFESESGISLTPGAPVTVDGVVAQTYIGDSLFAAKLVYFDHAGIGYQIELPDTNPESEAVLTDVIADWSFIP